MHADTSSEISESLKENRKLTDTALWGSAKGGSHFRTQVNKCESTSGK